MTPTDTADAPVPFGKYRLHRLIARGGMGEVYLATLEGELGFEKKLVVKTILPELAREERFVDLFAAEAKTAVALSHGNIVPIYELGRHDETLYIAMGYVDGPSVAQILSAHRTRGEAVPLGAALFIVRQVLTGMAYAHVAETNRPPVVHRDLSPRNVLVDRSGQVRIVDFGIAMPAHQTVSSRMGSTGYIAPEQARAASPEPSADVFSVGALLYELLTLEKAFPREGVWMAPSVDTVPSELQGPLERALSVDPANRQSDAGAFLDDLAEALQRHGAYAERDLAAHLRLLFDDGWEPSDAPATEGTIITPATRVSRRTTQTFATRLTDVVPVTAAAATPSSRSRRWIAVAALALLGGGATALTMAGDGDPERAPAIKTPADTPADTPRPAPPPAPVQPLPAPPQVFRLTVEPADARVRIGDRVHDGGSPYELPLPATGHVNATVFREGYDDQILPLHAGQPGTGTYTLTRKAPAEPGFLTVLAPAVSYAEVYVDGKKRENTPLQKLSIPAGKHRVRVVCPAPVCESERILANQTVTVTPGKTVTVEGK